MSSTGVNELFATGDMLSTVLKDVFTDVNIYDNDIRLLQYPFISYSSSDAISFYKFYYYGHHIRGQGQVLPSHLRSQ